MGTLVFIFLFFYGAQDSKKWDQTYWESLKQDFMARETWTIGAIFIACDFVNLFFALTFIDCIIVNL